MSVSLVGIDPGLVDTGAVEIWLDPARRRWSTRFERIDGGEAGPVKDFVDGAAGYQVHTFIEQYVDRGSSFSTHTPMRELEHQLKQAIPRSKLVKNTGVRKVVKHKLLQLLDVAEFPATHHQDLQSAARIALYGALKDDTLNALLTELLEAHLEGRDWVRV